MLYSSEAINEQTSESSDACDSVSSALRRALIALENGDFYTRWEAAKLISAYGAEAMSAANPSEVIEPLLHLLQEDDLEDELSWYVARILGTFDHPLAVQGLTQLLYSESSDVVGMAATALANCGAAAILPLVDLLHQPETRLLAIRALAQIQHPEVIQPLLKLTADSLPTVRATAIDALSRFTDPEIAKVFFAALRDVDSHVRRSAVSALGVQAQTLDCTNLVAALQPLLWDVNLEVCCQTALTLGRIGNSDAIAQLAKVLQSKTIPVPLQQAIVRAIGWMEIPEAIDALQQALFNTAILAEESQLEIVTVLGRLKKAETRQAAIQILLNLLHAQHPICQVSKGKQTIAHSLGQLAVNLNIASENQESNQNQVNRMIDALIDLLKDSDAGVQLHGIAALKAFDDNLVNLKLVAMIQNQTISTNLREGIAVALAERNRSIG